MTKEEASVELYLDVEPIEITDSVKAENTSNLHDKPEQQPKPKVDNPIVRQETATLQMGKTLRLLSLDKYGHREFWIYIYLENKDKISDPNNVPVGTRLKIPAKEKYGINANNPNSVRKAIDRATKELNRLG